MSPLHLAIALAASLPITSPPLASPAVQEARPESRELNFDAFPKPLHPYLENAVGLVGLEQSLTLQVAMSLGQVQVRKKLDKEFKESAQAARENWNELLSGLWSEVAGVEAGSLVGGGGFLDTGMTIKPDRSGVELRGHPEYRWMAFEEEGRLEEILEARRLVGGLRTGLSKGDAEALTKLVEKAEEAAGDDMNPWLMHANTHCMFMKIGAYEDYAEGMKESGTPFGTWEEFQDQMIDGVYPAIVGPLRAPATAAIEDAAKPERRFRYEGEFVVQVVESLDGDTEAPAPLIAANEADHSPTFLVQVEPIKKAKSKVKRVIIGMIVGGEFRRIYDGRAPLR